MLGDAGYQGFDKREENRDTPVSWHIALKRSKRKALPANRLGKLLEQLERAKASIRAGSAPVHVIELLQAQEDPLPWAGEERSATVLAVRSGRYFSWHRPLLALYARGAS